MAARHNRVSAEVNPVGIVARCSGQLKTSHHKLFYQGHQVSLISVILHFNGQGNHSVLYKPGNLMGFIFHKGLSTNSGHCISMVKVGDIWFECHDV